MRTLACVLALTGLAGIVHAESRPRHHVVTTALKQRLRPQTARNLAAVGRFEAPDDPKDRLGLYSSGTAFLVQRAKDGTGLVLTNAHVVQDRPLAGATVAFRPREDQTVTAVDARITGVVAHSRESDWALLSIELPARAMKELVPIQLDRQGVAAGQKVYSVGYPDVDSPFARGGNERVSVAIPRDEAAAGRLRAVLAGWGITGFKTIQTGKEDGRGQTRPFLAARGWALLNPRNWRLLQANSFKLPNAAGASGSPILSASTHRAVAVLFAGHGRGEALGVPIKTVAAELQRKLEAGEIDARQAGRVRQLLESTR